MRWLALAVLCLAGPLQAQELAEAPGAKLRILDKLTGEVQDVTLARGQAVVTGRLTVQLDSCRSPADNTVAEADAHLTILDAASTAPVFAGWMLATAPALSALDHPRYDVWVLGCDVPELALPEVEDAVVEEGADAPAEAADDPATSDSDG
jgi:hypothetical protein